MHNPWWIYNNQFLVPEGMCGSNDARQSLVTVLHGSGLKMLKYISIQNLKWIYHGVQELWSFSLKELDRPKWCSTKPCHRFAWQWLDNIQNLKWLYLGVQELWAFSLKELDQPKWCSVKPRHRFAWRWLDNVKVHKYTKFEVNIPRGSRVMSIFTNWSQILNWCSAKPRPSKKTVMHDSR